MSNSRVKQTLSRRIAVVAIAALAAAPATLLTSQPVLAGAFPEKPVTLIVPYRAGGSTETMAQVFSKALGEQLGQKVIVETRPGAGGAVGATYVSTQPADGYTLLLSATDTLTWTPMTRPDIEYDVDSFRYVASITEYQQAFVSTPDQPFETFEDLVAHSLANPGLNVADQGGMSKAFINFIAKQAGVDWTAIPTKGGGEMIPLLLGGKVDFAWSGGIHGRHGEKIRVLASANADRLAASPDVPSIKELYGISMPAAAVISVPAGTPDDVAQILEAAIEKASGDPSFAEILGNLKFPNKFVGSEALQANTEDVIAGLKEVIAAM